MRQSVKVKNELGEWIELAGMDGQPGKNGLNGKDGINGKDGADGKPGKDGKDGKDGIDGTPGKDGESIQGPKGDPGEGVPKGGTQNQILAKASIKDYDTRWIDPQSLVGKQGKPGVNGLNGLTGPMGPTGARGDPGIPTTVTDTSTINLTLNGTELSADVLIVPATSIELSELGTATYDDLQDYINGTVSGGRIDGGAITAHTPANGTIDISALKGFVKTSDSEIAVTKYFDIAGVSGWGASGTGTTLTDNSINYIYVDNSTGTPAFKCTTDRSTIKLTNQFNVGRCFVEGTEVEVLTSGINLYNHRRRTHERWIDTFGGISYASGILVSFTGLKPAISAGILYAGNNKITINAKDCNSGGTFDAFYYNPTSGLWVEVEDQTSIDNANYNNHLTGTGLTALSAGKYGIGWIYVCPEGGIYYLYGKGNYTLAQAQAAQVLTPIPNYLSQWAKLAAKVIFGSGSASVYSITSAWTTSFPTQDPADHNDLTGLQGGTSSQYYHATSAEYTGTGTGILVRKDSAALTGTPTTPTAAPDTNTTQIASCAFVVGQAPTLAYGVEWDPGTTNSPTLTRVDSNGVTITPNTADFNSHPIWGRIRRCNLSDAGVVTAYYGDAAYKTDGSNGQVMVQIPRFYYLASKTGTKYRWTICDKKLPGYKVHPAFVSDGVEKQYTYVGAFEASVYDVTASATEVNTITVTAEPTSTGNLTITLDGNYAFTVAVADADTIEGVVDKIVAAGNKTDYQGVVWTVSKVDASNVRYTAGSAGLKTTVKMPTACGVTSTIVKTTSGAGGYVLNDSSGVSTTATTGDKLCSIAGVKPASGWNNSITLHNFRTLANNRGTGWGLKNFNQMSAIQLLYLIEYATFQSQTAIGAGVTVVTDATAGNTYNNAINTGYTAGVGVNAVSLGNTTGEAASVTHYKTGEAAKANSYRGIENLYGNIWKRLDGLNMQDRRVWVADHDFATNFDSFSHPYVDSGITNCDTNGYPTDIGFSSTFDCAFLPSSITGTSPSSATYFCDYYYQATGNTAALVGGSWADGSASGAFYWYLKLGASDVYRYIGARLSYLPVV